MRVLKYMGIVAALMAAVMVLAMAQQAQASLGVVQDYLASNEVEVPRGSTVCHRIWPAGPPNENRTIQLSFDMLPPYISVKLSPDGKYPLIGGSSDPIIFHISSDDLPLNYTEKIRFTVFDLAEGDGGQVTLGESVGSSFTIRVVSPDTKVKNRCEPLPPSLKSQQDPEVVMEICGIGSDCADPSDSNLVASDDADGSQYDSQDTTLPPYQQNQPASSITAPRITSGSADTWVFMLFVVFLAAVALTIKGKKPEAPAPVLQETP
jgi:hypothetical protein